MRGAIEYPLWTVTGTQMLYVEYNIEEMGDEMMKVQLKVSGDGDKPELNENSELREEIIQACLKDIEEKEEEEEIDYIRVLPGSLWGAN